jgi:hypothetical protein
VYSMLSEEKCRKNTTGDLFFSSQIGFFTIKKDDLSTVRLNVKDVKRFMWIFNLTDNDIQRYP